MHSKQNFSFALVVGDLFGEGTDESEELDALLDGTLNLPLPVHFSAGNHDLPGKIKEKLESTDEVCPNLIYHGRKSTFTTTEGIRIVSLGGRLVENESSLTTGLSKSDPLYLESESKGLHGAHSAHILLTNQLPINITRFSNVDVPQDIYKESGSQPVANLCLALKPWYHFSSTPPAMWEREPFRHPEEYGSLDEAKVTRFKSVASVSAPAKEWMSAFSIDTARPPPAPQTTESPFLKASPPRKRAAPDDSYSRYGNGHGDHYGRRPQKRARQKDPSDCFMCINKPGFKAHMVASIGDESTVTILRGPLPYPGTFPQLSFSGHVMVIPHYHAADELANGRRTSEEVNTEFDEMSKFRKALSKMIGSKSNGELGTVCWEVNRTGVRHFHLQLIAAQAEKVRKGLIEAAFKIMREKYQLQPFEDCDAEKPLEQRSDYFRLWTWAPSSNPVARADGEVDGDADDGVTKSMWFSLPANEQGFNIWFGREVMAGIMQLEDRVNWMSALHPDEAEELKIEEADAGGLKEDFAEFDFAMQ